MFLIAFEYMYSIVHRICTFVYLCSLCMPMVESWSSCSSPRWKLSQNILCVQIVGPQLCHKNDHTFFGATVQSLCKKRPGTPRATEKESTSDLPLRLQTASLQDPLRQNHSGTKEISFCIVARASIRKGLTRYQAQPDSQQLIYTPQNKNDRHMRVQ